MLDAELMIGTHHRPLKQAPSAFCDGILNPPAPEPSKDRLSKTAGMTPLVEIDPQLPGAKPERDSEREPGQEALASALDGPPA